LTDTSDAPTVAPAGSGARSLRRAVAMLTLIHRRGQPQSLA
jgi:hypothetical protein